VKTDRLKIEKRLINQSLVFFMLANLANRPFFKVCHVCHGGLFCRELPRTYSFF